MVFQIRLNFNGMILVIPSPDNILDFMKKPTVEESDANNNIGDKPIVKQKHEKRKANEGCTWRYPF